MGMEFKAARREAAKAKIAITGPSGSGKTLGALYIAAGLAGPSGRIGVIDSENASALLYADAPDAPPFEHLAIAPPFSAAKYVEALHAAEAARFDVIIIDSISHAWAGEGGVLDEKESIAQRKAARSGGKEDGYAAWNEAGKIQNAFINAILQSPAHVICTMRAKQAYEVQEVAGGKKKIVKLGLAPVQREGVEYEFATVFDVDMTHTTTASKDRSGLFVDKYFAITKATGETLAAWLKGQTLAPIAPAPVAALIAPPKPVPAPAPAQAPPASAAPRAPLASIAEVNALTAKLQACGYKGWQGARADVEAIVGHQVEQRGWLTSAEVAKVIATAKPLPAPAVQQPA